jgi:hypothetical protein
MKGDFMMKRKRTITSIAVAVIVALQLLGSSITLAHNAGHFFLKGRCITLGSLKPGPFVGPNKEQLDLIEGPGDQFGVRYAADQGLTPVLPGECP